MHTAKLCLALVLVAATSTHVAAVELVNPLQVLERSRRAGIEFDQAASEFSCLGRAVDPVQAMARVKRSPKRMANCALAMHHSRAGMVHSFSERFKTRNNSFRAASSVGKWPRARTARRSFEFRASMALVVYNSRRTSAGKA